MSRSMEIMPTSFFDASALVKLFAREPGRKKVEDALSQCGRVHTSWILLGEALGAFKRKRRDGTMTDHEYGRAAFELFMYVREGRIHPVDLDIQDGEPVPVTTRERQSSTERNTPSSTLPTFFS